MKKSMTLFFVLCVAVWGFCACQSPTARADITTQTTPPTVASAPQENPSAKSTPTTETPEPTASEQPPITPATQTSTDVIQRSAPTNTVVQETSSTTPVVSKETPNAPASSNTAENTAPPETKQNIETENPVQQLVYLSITGVDDQVSILPQEAFEAVEGETVFGLLLRATKAKKIQMEFIGKDATCYVQGIDNLYEFDKGEGSGWMVCVNGIFINKSAGAWPIKEGDIVEWKYTRDLGKDIGGSF